MQERQSGSEFATICTSQSLWNVAKVVGSRFWAQIYLLIFWTVTLLLRNIHIPQLEVLNGNF